MAAAPVIESVTPASAPAGGGTAIKIAGSGFAEGLTVVIGDVQATDVVVESETNLGVVVPPGAAGIVDVTVINPDGQQTSLTGAFTYEESEPVADEYVDSVFEPSSGVMYVANRGPNTVDVIDAASGILIERIDLVMDAPSIVALTPDGRMLLVGYANSVELSIVDLTLSPPVVTATHSLAGSPALIVATSDGYAFYLIEASDPGPLHLLDLGTGQSSYFDDIRATALARSDDGKVVLVATGDEVSIYDTITQKLGEPVKVNGFGTQTGTRIIQAAAAAGGSSFAVGHGALTVVLDASLTTTAEMQQAVLAPVFAPDGDLLYGLSGTKIYALDTANGTVVASKSTKNMLSQGGLGMASDGKALHGVKGDGIVEVDVSSIEAAFVPATPTPTVTPTDTLTVTPTVSANATPTMTIEPPTPTPSVASTETVTPEATATPTSSSTPGVTETPTPVPSQTATPEVTLSPTPEPSLTPTPTAEPTVTPNPEPSPTPTPSAEPTLVPTMTPTPTPEPELSPTPTPQATPTPTTTSTPASTPTAAPTNTTAPEPTPIPEPTATPVPTGTPTVLPSPTPTPLPELTDTPTPQATETPTPQP